MKIPAKRYSRIGLSFADVYIPRRPSAKAVRGKLEAAWRKLVDGHTDSEMESLGDMTVEVVIKAVRRGR